MPDYRATSEPAPMLNAEELFVNAVDLKSFHYDFGDGRGERWDLFRTGQCDCGARIYHDELVPGHTQHRDLTEIDTEVEQTDSDAEYFVVASRSQDGYWSIDGDWTVVFEDVRRFTEQERGTFALADLGAGDAEWQGFRGGAITCEDYVRNSEPVMNYIYPLPEGYDPDSFRHHPINVAGLPLVVVQNLDEDGGAWEYGLALTGGGMDMSWYITEAYMRLGYCPPLDVLPRDMSFAPKSNAVRMTWLLNGMDRTAEVAEGWAQQWRKRVSEFRKDLKRPSLSV